MNTQNHLSEIKNSTVFVRVDLNVPMWQNKITDPTRISKILPTIKQLSNQNNTVILASHLGRPNGIINEKFTLRPIFEYIQQILPDNEIIFINDLISQLKKELLKKTPIKKKIIFLENLRFYSQEESNDTDFKKLLSNHIDYYINEAFSCSHRAHASIMMAEHFPTHKKYPGLLMKEELDNINQFCQNNQNLKKIAIIAGSKISTKIQLIQNLQNKVDYIFIGGAMANTILAAQNFEMGLSLKEEFNLNNLQLNQSNCRLILPNDLACTQDTINNESFSIKSINNLNNNDIALDIGPQTIENLKNLISQCDQVIWNGPLGLFEQTRFANSTMQIAQHIAIQTSNGKIKSLLGGGDTLAAINQLNINPLQFSYVSTAGGAFLEYIENDLHLIGIDALLN